MSRGVLGRLDASTDVEDEHDEQQLFSSNPGRHAHDCFGSTKSCR